MKKKKPSVYIVMPAYNAARTLQKTYTHIPKNSCQVIVLVDDKSQDHTVELARMLNIEVIEHPRNFGYGANQKTCYTYSLKNGADIIVMLHPDYQYDPGIINDLIAPIQKGEADVVLASRMLKEPLKGGMPLYRFVFNRILTAIENYALKTELSEFHTGYRAFKRQVLEQVNFIENSDDFIFDNEILVQIIDKGFALKEVPVNTRYAFDSSSVSFIRSVKYGLEILYTIAKYYCHKKGILPQDQFK